LPVVNWHRGTARYLELTGRMGACHDQPARQRALPTPVTAALSGRSPHQRHVYAGIDQRVRQVA